MVIHQGALYMMGGMSADVPKTKAAIVDGQVRMCALVDTRPWRTGGGLAQFRAFGLSAVLAA